MTKILALAMALYLLFSLAACVSRTVPKIETPVVRTEVTDADFTPEPFVVDAQFAHVSEGEEENFPLLVRIDDQLYESSGEESDIDGRCGMMDGRIDSSVERGKIPGQNGQSNFGAPYGYQYGTEGRIEVNLAECWLVFTPVQNTEENT